MQVEHAITYEPPKPLPRGEHTVTGAVLAEPYPVQEVAAYGEAPERHEFLAPLEADPSETLERLMGTEYIPFADLANIKAGIEALEETHPDRFQKYQKYLVWINEQLDRQPKG